MLKIRSTEKLATSNSQGFCDMSREMLSYNENIRKGITTIVIEETLFQEKNSVRTITEVENDVEVEKEIEIVERLIVENRIAKAYTYKASEIDSFYSAYGSTISKIESFSQQQDLNKQTILLLHTSEANRQGMSNWVADTEHVIVLKFTE